MNRRTCASRAPGPVASVGMRRSSTASNVVDSAAVSVVGAWRIAPVALGANAVPAGSVKTTPASPARFSSSRRDTAPTPGVESAILSPFDGGA